MARLVSEQVPGFVNEKGQWPRQLHTMLVDGASIVIGSLLGTSPLTVFAESAVGIREGGRTGITALIVAGGEWGRGGTSVGGKPCVGGVCAWERWASAPVSRRRSLWPAGSGG